MSHSDQLEMKLNIGSKEGKCYSKIVRESQANVLIGLKIGDQIKGDIIGLSGYEFQITGASDRDGFPHRSNVQGSGRRKLLLRGGIGYRIPRKGRRVKKSVRGNTLSEASYQINLKIIKKGQKALDELISGGV